jgi:AraC-like DNA-binding protein
VPWPRHAQSHHRSSGPVDFVTLTLDTSDLTRVAFELTGREVRVEAGKVLRPPAHLNAALLSVVEAGMGAAQTTAGLATSPQAADALEHALLRPMVMCLLHGEARRNDIPLGRRSALAKRFEEAVEANFDCPLPISDLCRVIGVSGRTLRSLCRVQLGISPQRFLALRRLHLARQVLLLSDPDSSTVTEIATRHGLWELGRFAVAYKALFGESPSATLHRRP